jgi:hypothetical protein
MCLLIANDVTHIMHVSSFFMVGLMMNFHHIVRACLAGLLRAPASHYSTGGAGAGGGTNHGFSWLPVHFNWREKNSSYG